MSEPHYSFPQRTPVFTAAVVILCFAAFAWLGYRIYAPTRSDNIAPAATEFPEDVRWRMTPKGRAELRQTIATARERGVRVVASRVEDAQCAAMLWSTGVDFIQGNFVQAATQELDFDFAAAAM